MYHPYFKHPYFTNGMTVNGHGASPINCENAIAVPCNNMESHYSPAVVDSMLKEPVWTNTSPERCEIVAGFFNRMNAMDGYRVGENCNKIVTNHASMYNGYISAMGVVIGDNGNTAYPTYIVNTENAGLRMVSFDENGYDPMDIGPVEDMMIIGNDARPEGIYVPLCNMKAVADAAVVIGKELKRYEETIIANELKANVTKLIEEAHECKCGGDCKCGGSCSGNCKCHHD